MQAEQNQVFIDHSPCSNRCSSIPRTAESPHADWLPGKTNTITPNIPGFFPQFNMFITIWFILLGGCDQLSHLCALPTSYAPTVLCPTNRQGNVRSRRSLDVVQASLSKQPCLPLSNWRLVAKEIERNLLGEQGWSTLEEDMMRLFVLVEDCQRESMEWRRPNKCTKDSEEQHSEGERQEQQH